MRLRMLIFMLLTLLLGSVVPGSAAQLNAAAEISGEIVNGLRKLVITPGKENNFVIYRGDYVQPEIVDVDNFALLIPELQVQKQFPVKAGEKAYIKMKKTGLFNFTAGTVSGTLQVIDYAAASYRELSSDEAGKILQNTNPLILDVRTQREFQQSHIEGANLLPVQVLQQYIDKLEPYKNQDILIYCATGNRSTVASRLLIESGFMKIYNLRHGISDWSQRGYPVTR